MIWCPKRTINRKPRGKQWVNNSIKEMIKTKYQLYSKTVTQPLNEELKSYYRRYKSVFNKDLHTAEILYHKGDFTEGKYNKMLWFAINEELNKKNARYYVQKEVTCEKMCQCKDLKIFVVNSMISL